MEKVETLTLEVFGVNVVFDVSVMISTTATCLVVLLLAFAASRNLRMIPSGIQNVMESVVEFIQDIVRSQMDSKVAPRFYSFSFTLFLFICIANQLGLLTNFMMTPEGAVDAHDKIAWWKSSTANPNVAISMALAITIAAHLMGLSAAYRRRRPGQKVLRTYISGHYGPLHLIGELTKPITHGMRLWANIFAGEVMIGVLLQGTAVASGLPLLLWLGYSFFVGVIQAYVFTMIAMVYFGQKLAEDH